MGTPGARSPSSSRRFPSRTWPSRTSPVKVRRLGAGQGSNTWEDEDATREKRCRQAVTAGQDPPRSDSPLPSACSPSSGGLCRPASSPHGSVVQIKNRCLFLQTFDLHQSEICHNILLLLKRGTSQPSVKTLLYQIS